MQKKPFKKINKVSGAKFKTEKQITAWLKLKIRNYYDDVAFASQKPEALYIKLVIICDNLKRMIEGKSPRKLLQGGKRLLQGGKK